MNFGDLDLVSPLLKALEKKDFTEPTEIQKKVIPLAIKGKDILGCAQTGSGKTLSFSLPVLNNLYKSRIENIAEGKVIRKADRMLNMGFLPDIKKY